MRELPAGQELGLHDPAAAAAVELRVLLRHLAAGAEQRRLDRRLRLAELLGDLLVRQPAELAQAQDHALLLRQLVEGAEQAAEDLLALEGALHAADGGRRGDDVVVGDLRQPRVAARAVAGDVAAMVASHGAGVLDGLPGPGQRAVGARPRLLGDVLGALARGRAGDRHHERVVSLVELREGLLVASADQARELCIRCPPERTGTGEINRRRHRTTLLPWRAEPLPVQRIGRACPPHRP